MSPSWESILGASGASAVAVAVGFLVRQLGLHRVAAYDEPLDSARRDLKMSMRPLAAAVGALATGALCIVSLWLPLAPGHGPTLLGVGAAVAIGTATWFICRGVGAPTPAAWAAAALTTLSVLADRFDAVQTSLQPLRAVSFPVGEHRVTLLGLITSLATLLVLYAAGRFAYRLATLLIRRSSRWDEAHRTFAEKVVAIVLVTVVVLVSLDVAGLGGTLLTLFSGTLGLGLGFGLRSVLSNLVAGLLLLWERSVKPGDTIAVDETVGEVTSVGIRAVAVKTRDEKVYLIPNETLITDTVENWGFGSHDVRERIVVEVAMDSDLDLVEDLLVRAAASAPRVLTDPAPAVRITDLTPSGIKHELRFWIADPERGRANVKHLVYRDFLRSFAENGIRMPSPGVEVTRTPASVPSAFDD